MLWDTQDITFSLLSLNGKSNSRQKLSNIAGGGQGLALKHTILVVVATVLLEDLFLSLARRGDVNRKLKAASLVRIGVAFII